MNRGPLVKQITYCDGGLWDQWNGCFQESLGLTNHTINQGNLRIINEWKPLGNKVFKKNRNFKDSIIVLKN